MTTRRALRWLSLGVALLCVASCGSKPSAAPKAKEVADAGSGESKAPSVARVETLPAGTRQLLSARMQRHGEQLTALMNAVVVLDWRGVQRASGRVIEEPALAPPLAGDSESLNARLPSSFFVYQRELLTAVRELSAAAAQRSDHALKVAFNGVAGACIQCHSAYLQEAERPDIFEDRSPCQGVGCPSQPGQQPAAP